MMRKMDISKKHAKKLKVLVVTGTRAEYGLLRPVVMALKKSKQFEPALLVTGMHTLTKFGHTLDEIKRDHLKIASAVKISEKDDMLQSLSKEIAGISKYCKTHPVDLMLVLGDRDEPLAGAIVAAHLKVPVAHINGGDVSGKGVDESIRHAITKFSHLHFTSSKHNAKRVLALGEEPSRIFNVGATGLDSLKKIKYLSKKEVAKKFHLDLKKRWFLLVHHSTPLEATPLKAQIAPLLKSVSGYEAEIVIIYPNSDTGSDIFIKEIEKYSRKKNIHIFKNLPRRDYLNLLKTSNLLIGNSSSGIIESTYFKLPTIDIGSRQKNRERGANIIHSGYGENEVKSAVNKATSSKFKKLCAEAKSPYGAGDVSNKILNILEKHARILAKDKEKIFFKKQISF